VNADPDVDARDAVRAVRRGDRDAFGRVVALYQRRLFGLALMMTRDPAGAEDVAQDAFVRAFVHLDAYDERHPFYPWLSSIAVRLAQNWLVKRGRLAARERAEPAHAGVAASSPVDPLAAMIADEHDRRLWHSVASLPSGERTAAILYYREELTIKEIAFALGVTAGTVKTLLFRARLRLRRTLVDREKDSR
jgi:RNA polymerase sigma-70 factor (ECF subfamily)